QRERQQRCGRHERRVEDEASREARPLRLPRLPSRRPIGRHVLTRLRQCAQGGCRLVCASTAVRRKPATARASLILAGRRLMPALILTGQARDVKWPCGRESAMLWRRLAASTPLWGG